MKARELAVWSAPGETPRSGIVIDRPARSPNVLVEWDDGERAKIRKKDPAIRFVPEGSVLAKWALNIGDLEELLRRDPADAFRRYLQEQPESVTAGTLTKAIATLGFTSAEVKSAWDRANPVLRSDPHVDAHGQRFRWSDEPIDPLATMRSLPPEQALQRLLKGRLAAGEKQALAEAVRAGFRV
jgi:hypothetical protein